MTGPRIGLVRLPHGAGLPLPAYQSDGAAGADLCAAVAEAVTIEPLARALIPTGLAFDIPAGFEIQVRPRSGLAARHGITILNAPGTIDSDYRGEVQVLLVNLGTERFVVSRGDRIAQIVVAPVVTASFEAVEALSASRRGSAGFGSTGIKPPA